MSMKALVAELSSAVDVASESLDRVQRALLEAQALVGVGGILEIGVDRDEMTVNVVMDVVRREYLQGYAAVKALTRAAGEADE